MAIGKATANKLAIVLGVHRSGTSLLAAGLEALGAYLGVRPDHRSEENQRGFFENETVVAFNDRLLEFLGGRWDNPLFDGLHAVESKGNDALGPWYDEAGALYEKLFAGQPFVAIKDPRLCQLLPFWVKVFRASGYARKALAFVHIVRHPMEVARSQLKRQQRRPEFYGIGAEPMETVALWMQMSLQALRDVDSDNNIVVDYADLVAEPREQLERLAAFLSIEADERAIESYCRDFVDPALKRNTAGQADDRLLEAAFPEARALYLEQKRLASAPACKRSEMAAVVRPWKRSPFQQHFLQPLVPLFSSLATQRVFLHHRASELEQLRRRNEAELLLLRDKYDDMTRRLDETAKDRERVRQEFGAELTKLRAEVESVIADREKVAGDYEAEMGKLRAQVGAVLTDRDQVVANYQHEIEKLQAVLQSVMGERDSARAAVDAERETRARAEQMLAELQASFSWRVTAPLRRLSGGGGTSGSN